MMPASDAPALIEDARAFFCYLKRQYNSERANRYLSVLTDDAATKMAKAMSNPELFGMGKSMLNEGTKFPSSPLEFPQGLPGTPTKNNAMQPRSRERIIDNRENTLHSKRHVRMATDLLRELLCFQLAEAVIKHGARIIQNTPSSKRPIPRPVISRIG